MQGKISSNVILDTAKSLSELRQKHEDVVVSFSGGKDSLAVLDLCAKAGFNNIVCVHFYFIPGLRVVENQLNYARERYRVKIIEYPSPSALAYLANGDFSDVSPHASDIAFWTHDDMVRIVREDTGIRLFASGHKRTDAIGQGLSNAAWANKHPDEIQPIVDWSKRHVIAYLMANKIPIPETDGRNSSSIDLTPKCLIWLWNNHREDFFRIQKVFPYVKAVIARKKFFNIFENDEEIKP